MIEIPIDKICERLSVDIASGEIRWRKTEKAIRKGEIAGMTHHSKGSKPYRRILFDGKSYLVHRILWCAANKMQIPRGMEIDHINGDSLDNSASNLRAVTHSVNGQNQRQARSDSASGLLGVFRGTAKHPWRAMIRVGGKLKSLGLFDTKESAHSAYISAKREYHEGCTI